MILHSLFLSFFFFCNYFVYHFRMLCLGCHISASLPSLLMFSATVLDWVPFRISLAQVSWFVQVNFWVVKSQSRRS
jgi:hypothetical protein